VTLRQKSASRNTRAQRRRANTSGDCESFCVGVLANGLNSGLFVQELEYYAACIRRGYIIGPEVMRSASGCPLLDLRSHVVITYEGLKFLREVSSEAKTNIALAISILMFLLNLTVFILRDLL